MNFHRTRRTFLGFLVLFLGLTGAAALSAQPPATIYLIRHAEKLTDGREDLSPKGYERAKVLPNLFLPHAGAPVTLLPAPQFIFATHLSKHSNRPVETVTPLAASLKLPINSDFLNEDHAKLAAELLSGKYAGKIVLVSWHHGNIPALTTDLGAQPPYTPWPDQQFDRIWRIDWKDGKATVTDLPQEILPGDSK